MSRRLTLALACGIGQVFTAGAAVGAPGLDRFGRVADLHYIGVTAPLPGMPAGTVHRYEYKYDASGNRTHARVVQAPPNWNGGGTGVNRSWTYGYDALQRLADADRGTAAAGGNPGDPISLTTTDVATAWNLDNLGNWTGFTEPGSPPTTAPRMRDSRRMRVTVRAASSTALSPSSTRHASNFNAPRTIFAIVALTGGPLDASATLPPPNPGTDLALRIGGKPAPEMLHARATPADRARSPTEFDCGNAQGNPRTRPHAPVRT